METNTKNHSNSEHKRSLTSLGEFMPYNRPMIEYPCKFDPEKTRFAEVFRDPVAMALWIAYRGFHLCNDETIEAITVNSIRISEAIKKNDEFRTPEGKGSLKSFITMNLLRGSSHSESAFRNHDIHPYFKYVYPYLIGEKTASIKIMI